MSKRIFSKFLLPAVLLSVCSLGLGAQTYGSYTPYSIFGVGDMATAGTAYNKSMGGVGIAARNNRFINPLNPAAVTARDSLSFMADYSLFQDNKIFRQGNSRSASNTMNIGDLIITFPIWRSSAMSLGVTPLSSTGYGYSYNVTDPSIIGRTGNISYTAAGRGGVYQAFAGAGVTFFKRLSVGAQFIYNFGKIQKSFTESFSNSSYNGATNGHTIQINAPAGKVGLQYEQPLGKNASLTLGATYRTPAKLLGRVESYRYSTGTAATDTLYHNLSVPGAVSLASEQGIGLCFRYADKFMVELDYTRSDWRKSGMDKTEGFTGNLTTGPGRSSFTTSVSEAYRLGFELVPNRNDIRYYWRKIAYRAGAYWKNEYYLLDGAPINSYGITLGATLPVFRWYNGITFGMDFGQRGSLKDGLVRETYFNFSVGFNLFDIWFQKFSYD
ncbi:MAG: hypothetical protein J6S62_02140 [Bacteroidales bacterium]|nr:hypothetical protein [Bacteroidales bacterium]